MNPVRLIEYFQKSDYEYLALEVGGTSIVLERASRLPGVRVDSPGAGTITAAPRSPGLPKVGDVVAPGQLLFAIRRFRTQLDVTASIDGEIVAIDVEPGQFVEYGAPLVHIAPARI